MIAHSVIRIARDTDISGIQQVAEKAWDDTYQSLILPENRRQFLKDYYSSADLSQELARDRSWFFVAEEAGRVIGFAQVTIRNECHAYLTRIYLLPGVQRRGLGTQFFQTILRVLEENAAVDLTISVEKRNIKARRFYEKMGLRAVSEYYAPLTGETLSMVEYTAKLPELKRSVFFAAI